MDKENGLRYYCKENDVVIDFLQEESELHIYGEGSGDKTVVGLADFDAVGDEILTYLRAMVGIPT